MTPFFLTIHNQFSSINTSVSDPFFDNFFLENVTKFVFCQDQVVKICLSRFDPRWGASLWTILFFDEKALAERPPSFELLSEQFVTSDVECPPDVPSPGYYHIISVDVNTVVMHSNHTRTLVYTVSYM